MPLFMMVPCSPLHRPSINSFVIDPNKKIKEYLRDLSVTLYKRKMTISRLYDNINMLLKCTVHSLPLKLNDGVFSVSSFCVKFRTN